MDLKNYQLDYQSNAPQWSYEQPNYHSANASNDYKADLARMYAQANMDLQMSKYQYDMSLEQWQRENAYNSPSQQMQRLKDAGLNPNLAYDHIGNQSGSSPQMSPVESKFNQTDYRQRKFEGLVDAVSKLSNMRYQSAQVDNLEATNDNLRLDAVQKALQNEKESANRPYYHKNASYQSDALKMNNDLMRQNILESDWRMKEGSMNNEAQRANLYSALGLNDKQQKLIEKQIYQIDNDVKRNAFLATISASQAFSNIQLTDKQIEKISKEIEVMDAEKAKQISSQPLYESLGNLIRWFTSSSGLVDNLKIDSVHGYYDSNGNYVEKTYKSPKY